MTKFGKYAILQPVTYNFAREPEWFWKIKPATISGELEIARLLSTERVCTNFDGMKTSITATTIELAMREIAVTFAGTNILGDDNVNPALKDNASIEQIEALLQLMPREMILEIWEAVGNANPGWGPVMGRYKTSSTPETDPNLSIKNDEVRNE